MTTSQTTKSNETNKEAYAKKLQGQLDEWKADIDKLEAKARKGEADAQIKLEEQVNDAKKRWEAAKNKTKELQNASEKAWNEMKDGAESAFASLKDSMDRARSHLS